MYAYMLAHYSSQDPAEQELSRRAAERLRLTVSGSAPLPLKLAKQWQELSGGTLLERYGMSETGMLLSNPLHGNRRLGHVGQPLPGVSVRLAADSPKEGGPLEVHGSNMFREYWQRPEATHAAFTPDGWFKTGDTAAVEGHPTTWRILGRTAIDMIKVGGHKVSALSVENVLGNHSAIREVAVVGLPHDKLGEELVALVSTTDPALTEEALLLWAGSELPSHEVPQRIRITQERLPRNDMGKVMKRNIQLEFVK